MADEGLRRIVHRTTFELGKVVVDAAVATTGVLPVAGSLLQGGADVVALAVHRRNARMAERFFVDVATMVEAGLSDEAASEIRVNLDEPWAFGAIAEGFDAIRGSFDEAARTCIAALVADYVRGQQMPDRFYRRAANLFQECDSKLLGQLACVTKLHTGSAAKHPEAQGRYLIAVGRDARYFWGLHTRLTEDSRDEETTTEEAVERWVLVNLLVKHGFGTQQRGFADDRVGGPVELVFSPGQEMEIARVHLYVKARNGQ